MSVLVCVLMDFAHRQQNPQHAQCVSNKHLKMAAVTLWLQTGSRRLFHPVELGMCGQSYPL